MTTFTIWPVKHTYVNKFCTYYTVHKTNVEVTLVLSKSKIVPSKDLGYGAVFLRAGFSPVMYLFTQMYGPYFLSMTLSAV